MALVTSNQKVVPAQLLVLAAIHFDGPQHGYKLHQKIQSWAADEWADVKTGSVYHALAALKRQGYLTVAGAQTSREGPQKNLYTLTKTGKQHLLELLRTALMHTDLKILSAGIACMRLLPRTEVLELLRQNLQSQLTVQAHVRSLPTQNSLEKPTYNPELVKIWVAYHDSCTDSVTALIKRLEDGEYSFGDEH